MGVTVGLGLFVVGTASALLATWRYGADSRDGEDWSRPGSSTTPASHAQERAFPPDRRGAGPGSRPEPRRSAGGPGMAMFVARLVRLFMGLVGFGVSLGLMVRAQLGLGPWDVLHQGIAERAGMQIGSVVVGVSALVLLLWIPLRQRPGIGTVANAIVVGLVLNATLVALPSPDGLALRTLFLLVGIVGNGVATGLYIGAGLGPGPRDGLMTGLARRGFSIRVARTAIELFVLGLGWILGGSVGIGTVLYATGIGPLAHYFIPRLTVRAADSRRAPTSGSPPDSFNSTA